MLDTANARAHVTSQFSRLENQLNGDRQLALHRWRRESFDRMSAMPFPGPRLEEWKYTNPEPLLHVPYESYPGRVQADVLDLHRWAEPSIRLVFVNGVFQPAFSETGHAPSGLRILHLREAGRSESEAVSRMASELPHSDDNLFAEMNNTFMTDGVLIRVDDGAVIDVPIHCLFLSAPTETPLWTHPRNLIRIGAGACVNITEEYVTAGSGVHFTNTVTQLFIERDAHVHYQKCEDESREAFHIGMTQATMQGNSRLHMTTVALGGRLTRHVVQAVLQDEGIEATINGLYLAGGTQHTDHRTFIDHAKPHCASHELYKGILDGKSTGVFNGKILVRPDAQKTDAKQSNNNLLLSPDATVNTKPQLEIFADDVKCTHGATIGRLDEEAMFYLRTRGLNRDAARNILTYAFAADIIERIEVASLRAKLDDLLKNRLQH